jgi:hypothetical protein
LNSKLIEADQRQPEIPPKIPSSNSIEPIILRISPVSYLPSIIHDEKITEKNGNQRFHIKKLSKRLPKDFISAQFDNRNYIVKMAKMRLSASAELISIFHE